MSARWKIVPAELPAPYINVNGEVVHELRGPVADVYSALVSGAPRASDDAGLVGALTDALWDIFDECDIESIPEKQRRKLARAIIAYMEGAQ